MGQTCSEISPEYFPSFQQYGPWLCSSEKALKTVKKLRGKTQSDIFT